MPPRLNHANGLPRLKPFHAFSTLSNPVHYQQRWSQPNGLHVHQLLTFKTQGTFCNSRLPATSPLRLSTFRPSFRTMRSPQTPQVSTVHRDPLAASVYKMDRNRFKKSGELGFVRRHRLFQADQLSNYSVQPESLCLSKWNSYDALIASLISQNPSRPMLRLIVIALKDDIFRVIMDDLVPPTHERHVAKDVLVENPIGLELRDGMLRVTDEGCKLIIDEAADHIRIVFHPFALHLVGSDHQKTAVSFNDHSRLRVEDYTDVQGDDGTRAESFNEFIDSKPRGPESVGVDISFPNATHLHGIPERTSRFALPNTVGPSGVIQSEPYRMYNLDVSFYELDSAFGLYGSIPLLFARNEQAVSGVFWHNTSETYVDLINDDQQQSGKQSHWYSESGLIDMFLLPGPSAGEVFKKFLTLTGTPAMQQRFVLGYHQCRYSYINDSDVRFVDAGFDEHSIPYDTMWLDIGHTDGKKYFTWNDEAFPDPIALRDHLVSKGRRMVTIVDPHIKRDDRYDVHKQATAAKAYVQKADGSPFMGKCWPGISSYLDFSKESAREVWSAQFHPRYYKYFSSSTHIWNDMNEPSVADGPEITFHKDLLHSGDVEHRHIHNTYGHQMISATYAGMRSAQGGNMRPFVLTRSFFAGSQRYAAVWTGDNTADWGHLECSVRMILALQICGIVMSGADAGGFFGNPDGELTTRWYQAAAFQPFFRGHSNNDTLRREPWLFGEPYTSHISEAIRTRYEYIPYWYTLMAFCSIGEKIGLGAEEIAPPMRPMWWKYPKTNEQTNETQWMVGDAIMVAPVLTAGAKRHVVQLPDSEIWYDLLRPGACGTKIKKIGQIEMDVDLGRMVVLQRGGTVVPKFERGGTTTRSAGENGLTIMIALDCNGKAIGKIYIDDGETFNFKNGKFLLSEVHAENGTITARKINGSIDGFAARDGGTICKAVVLGVGNVKSVILNGNSLVYDYCGEQDMLTIDRLQLSTDGGWELKIH